MGLGRHLGDAGEIFDDPGVGGSGRGHHRHHVVGVGIVGQGLAEVVAGQAVIAGGDEKGIHVEDPEGVAD